MTKYMPEGIMIRTAENKSRLSSLTALNEVMREGKIIESYAFMCDSEHNLYVKLGDITGIIPKNEGAIGIKDGSVRDIAVISRVNRPVCFVITDIYKTSSGAVQASLSRLAAQQRCMENYVKKLSPGDVINARITHLEHFGAFADIGCGIVSLLPIDTISVSRIDHPSQRFKVGDSIKAVVKSNDNGRICLTHKELLGTWEENADNFSVGQTVTGIVRSVESYGAFIELTPNLAGLAELKTGLKPGMKVSVYIKNIIPQKMKIKLIVIDCFDEDTEISPPEYYFFGDKISKFRYSPENCNKIIETSFDVQ